MLIEVGGVRDRKVSFLLYRPVSKIMSFGMSGVCGGHYLFLWAGQCGVNDARFSCLAVFARRV